MFDFKAPLMVIARGWSSGFNRSFAISDGSHNSYFRTNFVATIICIPRPATTVVVIGEYGPSRITLEKHSWHVYGGCFHNFSTN